MNKIQKCLEYRFTLSERYFIPKGEIDNPDEVVLKLQDIGWAVPFNPKDVEKGKAGKNDTLTKFVVFAFLGTFGTTIELFANATYYYALSSLRYNMP